MKNVHCSEKPFKCAHCDYVSANKAMLDKHVKLVHRKERNFPCRLCGKRFGQKVHLDVHISAVHIQVRFNTKKDAPVLDFFDWHVLWGGVP